MLINSIKYKSDLFYYKKYYSKSPSFASRNDSFERMSDLKNFNMKVFNTYTNSYCDSDVMLDLTKPQIISLKHNSRERFKDCSLNLDYNPQRFDYIFDKENSAKLKTMILTSTNGNYKTGYSFMSENLDKEYGYLELSKCLNPRIFDTPYYELLCDYPDFGITGPRVIVEYLQNWDDTKYGKIGHLADKLAVKFCLDNKMPLNIISVADVNSHVAHFLRGKRYLPVDKDTCTYAFFKNKYQKADINQILEELIKKAKATGSKVNLEGWGTQAMYMPKELALKYITELKQHPII